MKWTPDRIRALRVAFGDTQEDFARRCRGSLPTIQHWEQGKGEPLGTATLALDYLEQQAIASGIFDAEEFDRTHPAKREKQPA